ncbi:hypothetical protein D3C73_1152760 [compost metagenome]
MERAVIESSGLPSNWTAETPVDVMVVFTDAQYCQSTVRLTGPLLEVLVDIYTSLNDVDEEEEEEEEDEFDDRVDLTTLEGVQSALQNYSERAGDEDDVWTIINMADMTVIG